MLIEGNYIETIFLLYLFKIRGNMEEKIHKYETHFPKILDNKATNLSVKRQAEKYSVDKI